MKILIVSATPFEILPLKQYLGENNISTESKTFSLKNCQVSFLETGVGIPATLYALSVSDLKSFDLIINAGIAGSLSRNFEIGQVFEINNERFADLGVQEKNGTFTDVFELGLAEKNHPPFENGWIVNKNTANFNFLPKAFGITVNKVHGESKSIEIIKNKYPEAQIETMEGASFAFYCALQKLNYLQVRSISNFVEPRNRKNWKISLAIDNLNKVLIDLISSF